MCAKRSFDSVGDQMEIRRIHACYLPRLQASFCDCPRRTCVHTSANICTHSHTRHQVSLIRRHSRHTSSLSHIPHHLRSNSLPGIKVHSRLWTLKGCHKPLLKSASPMLTPRHHPHHPRRSQSPTHPCPPRRRSHFHQGTDTSRATHQSRAKAVSHRPLSRRTVHLVW